MIVVEPPLRMGETLVTVLASQKVEASSSFGILSCRGSKVPIAVVLRRVADVTAYHPDGRQMDLEELTAICRGSAVGKKAISDLWS